ncbi:MAG TPA: response regulator, partial [Gemmatimonadales bacterium]|nr:response regulator [Gemmatimonadales bacterium]
VDAEPAEQASEPAASERRRGTETILVVEDNPSLQRVAERGLTAAGYAVLVAGSAEEAITVLERADRKIDLIFTDFALPGMSGRELGEWVARTSPAIRMLYTSGYTDDALLRTGVLDRSARFIDKPYTLSGLVAEIRAELDR